MGDRSLGPGSGWGFDLLSAAYSTGQAMLPIRPESSRIPSEINPVTIRRMTPEEIQQYCGRKTQAADGAEREAESMSKMTAAERAERVATVERLVAAHPDWTQERLAQEMGISSDTLSKWLKYHSIDLAAMRAKAYARSPVPAAREPEPTPPSPPTAPVPWPHESEEPEAAMLALRYTPTPPAPAPHNGGWTQQHVIRGRMPLSRLCALLAALDVMIGRDAEVTVDLAAGQESD